MVNFIEKYLNNNSALVSNIILSNLLMRYRSYLIICMNFAVLYMFQNFRTNVTLKH